MTTIVLARERTTPKPEGLYDPATAMVAFYDVLFRPRVPLHIGQHISIHALLPYNGEYSRTCGQGSPRFLAEDTGIEGTITEVRAMEETVTELVMRNDNAELDVAKAVLAIQHIEGVTVRLPKWKKLLRATILRPLPETRWIPIEPDAAVVKKTTRNEPPIIPLCLRCGLPSATNEQREWAWRLMEGEFGDLEDPRAVEAGELGVWGVMAADNEATGEGAAGTSE